MLTHTFDIEAIKAGIGGSLTAIADAVQEASVSHVENVELTGEQEEEVFTAFMELRGDVINCVFEAVLALMREKEINVESVG